jgi:hypothetical protein
MRPAPTTKRNFEDIEFSYPSIPIRNFVGTFGKTLAAKTFSATIAAPGLWRKDMAQGYPLTVLGNRGSARQLDCCEQVQLLPSQAGSSKRWPKMRSLRREFQNFRNPRNLRKSHDLTDIRRRTGAA